MSHQETILVLSNTPDEESAKQIAETLIKMQLAACVNILSPYLSIYRWQDQVERSTEIPIMIKTNKNQYAEVEKVILKLHPYELPEIITLNVSGGLPAYLQWVNTQLTN
jgi:periplasmic divalent cation tolerance protein